MSQGIYMIKNRANGKMYIGSSKNIEKRWKNHINLLQKGEHHNRELQIDWKKDDGSTLDFIILEHVYNESDKRLMERERYFVDKYDAWEKGYNYAGILNASSYDPPEYVKQMLRKPVIFGKKDQKAWEMEYQNKISELDSMIKKNRMRWLFHLFGYDPEESKEVLLKRKEIKEFKNAEPKQRAIDDRWNKVTDYLTMNIGKRSATNVVKTMINSGIWNLFCETEPDKVESNVTWEDFIKCLGDKKPETERL
ncbi:MAG: GIY-YIG nuclease family protein [Deltaproteobacteria bacterium]|nr:GIY-YIG nuclease family protein [Deltaproteobacteria bacterium]